jgi:hypothetical protein
VLVLEVCAQSRTNSVTTQAVTTTRYREYSAVITTMNDDKLMQCYFSSNLLQRSLYSVTAYRLCMLCMCCCCIVTVVNHPLHQYQQERSMPYMASAYNIHTYGNSSTNGKYYWLSLTWQAMCTCMHLHQACRQAYHVRSAVLHFKLHTTHCALRISKDSIICVTLFTGVQAIKHAVYTVLLLAVHTLTGCQKVVV